MLRLIESLSTRASENSLSDFPWLSLNQSEAIEQVCFPSFKIFSNLFAVELTNTEDWQTANWKITWVYIYLPLSAQHRETHTNQIKLKPNRIKMFFCNDANMPWPKIFRTKSTIVTILPQFFLLYLDRIQITLGQEQKCSCWQTDYFEGPISKVLLPLPCCWKCFSCECWCQRTRSRNLQL